MALLVEHVKKIVLDIAVLLLARWKSPIGDVLQLHLLHELFGTGLLQHFQQALVLRSTQLRLIQVQRCLVVFVCLECLLPGGDQCVDEIGLSSHQPRHGRVVLRVLSVALVADGTGDDERRSGFVDEHRVDFVDDRVDVVALNAMVQRLNHVVAQIVEAELVVRSVGDVAFICSAALHRARLGVVDTTHR